MRDASTMTNKMRVALIGGGAVGALHAASVKADPHVELAAVYSSRPERAAEFARAHGAAKAWAQLSEALENVDVAIVCSPSEWHFEQARECLRAGVHTLVELPACSTVAEAEKLGELAEQQGAMLGCAHTSRFLEPYSRVHAAVRDGWLGAIREIHFLRNVVLRARSWTDDALAHHAAHVLDLVLWWCGGLAPAACEVFPHQGAAQSVSLVGVLPGGTAMTAAISYGGKLPLSQMVVNTTEHSIVTDGFSTLRSDSAELAFTGDPTHVYEEAIRRQDALFLDACRGEGTYIPWADTVRLVKTVNQFKELSKA